MKFLYIASGGFGDASWTTSCPRILSEKGHNVDVYHLTYTGNVFHENPYCGKVVVSKKYGGLSRGDLKNQIIDVITDLIRRNCYDAVMFPNIGCGRMPEIVEGLNEFENIYVGPGLENTRTRKPLEIPGLKKGMIVGRPEFHFNSRELEWAEKLSGRNSIVIFPMSSAVGERTRNMNFDIINSCPFRDRFIVVHSGCDCLPADNPKRFEESGIRVLWEGYNSSDADNEKVLGKILALEALCKFSIHGYSGSICIALGFSKPFIMNVPCGQIRNNSSSPYADTQERFNIFKGQMSYYKSTVLSSLCITEKEEEFTASIEQMDAAIKD